MSPFWSARMQRLSPYIPGEQPKGRQFIKLNTNENPYPPSPKVIDAVQRAANEKLRLYPDPECSEFREAVAARYGVKPGQVFAGNGSDEVLAFGFGAFFESEAGNADIKSESVLFPDITYSFYPVYARLWNIPYKTIPLDSEFCIITADYRQKCGGVIFPNPNAPVGIAVPLNDILSLAKYLLEQGKVLIVDEAYSAFSANGNSVNNAASVVPHIGKYPNLLAVHTLSKSASIAGLRAGFAIGDENLIEGLRRMRDSFNSYTIDRLALAGAAAAVSDPEYYFSINEKVIATRRRVTETLIGFGCTVLPSSANFIFMKAPGIKGFDFFTALREEGILVRHFNKDRITDFIRVSIGTDNEMDVFLDTCGKIINNKAPGKSSGLNQQPAGNTQ